MAVTSAAGSRDDEATGSAIARRSARAQGLNIKRGSSDKANMLTERGVARCLSSTRPPQILRTGPFKTSPHTDRGTLKHFRDESVCIRRGGEEERKVE